MADRMAAKRAQQMMCSVGFFLFTAGCGGSGPAPSAAATPKPAVAKSEAVAPKPTAQAPFAVKPPMEDRMHQPFHKAIRAEPPANALPPVKTLTGKSIGKIFAEVENQWPNIRFVTAEGKKLSYRAIIETDFGNVEMELLPEIAPNHVRSFVALARAGYYDGLCFETRIGSPIQQVGGVTAPRAVDAGSPAGDARELSSVGYWLLPEIPMKGEQPAIRHEPGSVGASHGYEIDTAACRFYVTLTEAPGLDGNYTIFGKVTKGLDTVEKVFEQPVHENQADLAFVKPPRIRKVTIQVQEAGKTK